MTAVNLAVSSDFGYVLLAAAILAFEVLLVGALFPGRVRGQIFTEQYMKTHYQQVHGEAGLGEIKKGGYPDMGNGRYAERLPYSEWFRFNNAQRAHYNFVEGIATALTLLVIGGLGYPVVAASFGLVMIVGRMIYSIGYANSGPAGRLIGVLLVDIALIAHLVLSIMSCVKLIQGNSFV